MNLPSITGGEGAFLNNFKNCDGLKPLTGYAFPTILDADGYPTSTPSTTLFCIIQAMPQVDNPEWTVGWSGAIKINLLGPPGIAMINSDSGRCVVSNTSGNLMLGGTNCVVRFKYASAPGSLTVQFPTTGTYKNPSNLYMVRSDEKALFDAGEIFRPISAGMLLAKLSDLGISTIRFADWVQVVTNNDVSQWNFLARQTSLTYAGNRWEPTVFPGAPGSGVAASPIRGVDTYSGVATLNSTGAYVDGQVYQNIVINANTSTTPTLSVGGGPAMTIVDLTGGALRAGTIANNQLATFIYNAKLKRWLYRGGGMTTSVPIQIVTALCNKLQVNCWYQLPQNLTQSSIASYVAYVRDNLSPSLTAYFEYSNELFNPAASPLAIAQAVGTARNFPDGGGNYRDEYALNYRIAMGILTDYWAPRSMSTLVRVMSWAIFETPGSTIAQGHNLKLDASTNYCGGSGCTIVTRYDIAGRCSATNTMSGQPVDCVDAFAYGPYYNGAQLVYADGGYNNPMADALKAADDYASGYPARMSAALDFVDCDVRGTPTAAYPSCGYRNGALGGGSKLTLANYSTAGSTYQNYNTVATTWGKYIINYEGGYQVVPPSASRLSALATAGGYTTCQGGNATACSAAFNNLITAYKNDERFARLVYDQMMQFKSYSNSRMSAWYNLGPRAASNQWSVFGGGNLGTAPFQSYYGVRNYARGR